jgi:hypothetical protein
MIVSGMDGMRWVGWMSVVRRDELWWMMMRGGEE